jgi:hypothetical protein
LNKHRVSLALSGAGVFVGVGGAIFYHATLRHSLAFWAALSGAWAFDCLVRELIGGKK